MKYSHILILPLLFVINGCGSSNGNDAKVNSAKTIANLDITAPEVIIAKADSFLLIAPDPLTNYKSERSAGGLNDFYSEGDYWWVNPDDPDGPFIRRDGLSNPNNFLEHRKAMRNLCEWVSTLVAAYQISTESKYAEHAIEHLEKFFIDPQTRMNSNLQYAQAIKGRFTGRGIGIIDTIHLIEVAKAIMNLHNKKAIQEETFVALQEWFDEYSKWMNTSKNGLDEKDHGNNHSTWWAAQVAAFAFLANNDELLDVARQQFKKLLSAQMAEDGSFPDELNRTKPYNYSLFNLEGYAVICEVASTPQENLWNYEGANGSIKKAWDYMMPFINDKSSWTRPPDVSHFEEIPIKSVGLGLAAKAYGDELYYSTFVKLNDHKKSEEVRRNFPLWYLINWTS